MWCLFIDDGLVVSCVGCGIAGASAHNIEKEVEVADEMVLSSLLPLTTVVSASFHVGSVVFIGGGDFIIT